MKNLVILGSTGSIGVNTLNVVRTLTSINVYGLSAKENLDKLEEQIKEFNPKIVCLMDEEMAQRLRERVPERIEILFGINGLVKMVTSNEVDIVVSAVVGAIGLLPIIEAIKAKKQVAIANKEPLVMAGGLIMDLAKSHGVKVIPIDSEHSGVFQCLQGHHIGEIRRIILTASGGPFLRIPIEDLLKITPEEAISHPRWQMGKKISVDSATLMNKGLEVIEAHHLFGIDIDRISIIIHPESIVHSFVEFIDGSLLAQLSITDMQLPIGFALTYPERWINTLPRLNLSQIKNLSFEEPDLERFPCFTLALKAAKIGGTMPAVLSAANEMAVGLFLDNRIGFMDIPKLIEKILEKHKVILNPDLEEILLADAWAREAVKALC